jgi:ABC-type multidrug transport system permease subunit
MLVMYWMVGLQSAALNFFLLYVVIFMMGLAGNSVGMFLGSIIDDPQAISTAINLIVVPVEMFAGLFVNLSTIPKWLSWIQYTSPLKYGFAAGMIDETYQRPSMIGVLNFDMGFWECIGLLLAVTVVYRMLSLASLRILMKKLQ